MTIQELIPEVVELTKRLFMSGKTEHYYFNSLATTIVNNFNLKDKLDQEEVIRAVFFTRWELAN